MVAGETKPAKRVEIYTRFPRTAASQMSRSVMSRESASRATASPSNSELASPPNLRSATTVADYAPSPSVMGETEESDRAQLHRKRELGGPYYRSDEPAFPPKSEHINEQMRGRTYSPPGISSEGNAPAQDSQNMARTVSWKTSARPGLLTPPFSDTDGIRRYLRICAQVVGRSMDHHGENSPMGNGYLVAMSQCATPMQISPQSSRTMAGGNSPRNPFNPECSPRPYLPILPKPTAEKSAMALREQSTHGDRMQAIADAQRLWIRLDEQDPNGPCGPENGFSATAVQLAKYGREYVRIGLEQTPDKARNHWRSIRRARFRFG